MSGLSKIIKIIVALLFLMLIFYPVLSASAQDADGDGVSDTLEIEAGTDPLSKETAGSRITGFMSKDTPASLGKEGIILSIIVLTIGIEIGVFLFLGRKK